MDQELLIDSMLPMPLPPETEEEATDSIVSQMQAEPTGYEDGEANNIVADTHLAIKRALGKGESDETSYIEQAKALSRSALRLQLALDSQNALQVEATQPIDALDERTRNILGWDMMSKAQMALDNPVQAAVEANVALQVPYSIPMAVRDTLVLADTQLISMGRRIGDRKVIDFSFDNYVADFLAHLPGPRQGAGLLQFDYQLPDTEVKGYFDTLRGWQNLEPRQRMQIWEQLETALWDAAGNNALVYMSMALPFIYEEDEFWVKFNAIADVVDTALIAKQLHKLLFSTGRLKKAFDLTKRLMKDNDRALTKGNAKAAAEATVRRIRAKDIDAVKEGSPIDFADADASLSPGQGEGIQITLEDMYIYREAVKNGLIDEGEDLFVNMTPLRASELEEPLEAVRKAIISDGSVILSETATDGKVVFRVQANAKFQVPIEQLKAERVRYANELRETKEELKRLVTLDDEIGSNLAQKESLLERSKALRQEIATINEALKKAAPPKGSKLRVTSVAMPGTEIRDVTYRYTVDDASGIGKFSLVSEDGTSLYSATVGTPEAALGHLADDLVSKTTLLRQQQRRIFGLFDKPLRRIKLRLSLLGRLMSLDSTSRSNVEALLMHGDDVQKRFKDSELLDGITVPGLGYHKFTPREVESYNEMRDLYDDLWRIANKMQVDELNFGGYSQFYVRTLDTSDPTKFVMQRVYAKARNEDFIHSVPATRETPIKAAVDLDSGLPVKLDSVPNLQKNLESGKVAFVRLKDDVSIDGESYGYGLVNLRRTGNYDEAVNAFPVGPIALDYRKGYVSKLAGERVSHLAIVPNNLKKDGLDLSGEYKVLRGFKSGREAEIWVRKFIAENPDKPAPQVETLIAMRHSPDKRLTELADTVDNQLFRGAFVGHREESSRFLIGTEGREVLRVDPFTSMQRYADFVATNYPMHEWKQAQIKRFLDMSRKTDAAGNPSGGSWLDIPTRWDSKLDPAASNYRELKALQDNMRVMFSVPTSEEQLFNRLQRQIVTGFDRLLWDTAAGGTRFGPRASKVIEGMRETAAQSKALSEPGQALKGLTFDLMMSFLNLRQWFIQSSGMFIPTVLHPMEAARHFPSFLFLRTAQAIATDVKGFSKLARAVGLNPKEAEMMLRAWHKSGIPQSILENADFGFYHGTHGAYYSRPMMHEIRNKMRFFYDSGELNNRGFSFTMAYWRKIKQNKWNPSKPLNDEQLAEVVQEALRLNTNMSPANAAKWQNVPIVNLKTQFWQQTHKFYENMYYAIANKFNKNVKKENMWTGKEVASASIMHLLLGGAAGFGIDEMWAGLDQWMFDPNGGKLDPKNPDHAPIVAAIRGGLLEYMTMRGLGFALDVSDNVLPASGSTMITQAIGEWLNMLTASLKGEPVDFKLEMLIGASASIGTRFGDAFSKTLQALTGAANSPEGFTTEDWLGVITELSRLTSAGNNAQRAWTWRKLSDITDKNGRPLSIMYNGEPLSPAVIYAKIAGFDPLALEVDYLVKNRKKARDKEIQAASTMIKNALRRQLTAEGTLAPEVERRMAQNIIATVTSGLPDSIKNRAMAQAYEDLAAEGIDDFPLELYKRFYEEDTGSAAAKEALMDIKINEHYKVRN